MRMTRGQNFVQEKTVLSIWLVNSKQTTKQKINLKQCKNDCVFCLFTVQVCKTCSKLSKSCNTRHYSFSFNSLQNKARAWTIKLEHLCDLGNRFCKVSSFCKFCKFCKFCRFYKFVDFVKPPTEDVPLPSHQTDSRILTTIFILWRWHCWSLHLISSKVLEGDITCADFQTAKTWQQFFWAALHSLEKVILI